MSYGIYVLSRDKNNIITTQYCSSWQKLSAFLEIVQDQEIFCTMNLQEWYKKLKEWRKEDA